LFEQLNDSRVSTILETYTNSSRTHRLAFGRNALLEAVTHKVRSERENPAEVYVAIIDMDNVNFHKHRRSVFEGAMNLYKSWDSVSFNRLEYYDIWALRYRRYDNNFRSSSSPSALCPIIRKDIQLQLRRLNSSLYPVISAFNGFAMYKYKYMKGCRYIGHSHKRLDDFLGHPSAIGEDCEHVAFHKCMIAKHSARIMIYSDALILEPFTVQC
jgi:hypothetical protein